MDFAPTFFKLTDFTISTTTPILYYVALGVVSWLVSEVIFWVYERFILFPKINKPNSPPPLETRGPEWMLRMILQTLDIIKPSYPLENYIRGWFDYAPLEDVYLGNMKEIVAWTIYSKSVADLTESESQFVKEAVSRTHYCYNNHLYYRCHCYCYYHQEEEE